MHVLVEAEVLAVERDRGVDIVDDVADLNGGHSEISYYFLLGLPPMLQEVDDRPQLAQQLERLPVQVGLDVAVDILAVAGDD